MQALDSMDLDEILNITPSNTIGTYAGCHNIDKRTARLDFDRIKNKFAQIFKMEARSSSKACKVIVTRTNLIGSINIP